MVTFTETPTPNPLTAQGPSPDGTQIGAATTIMQLQSGIAWRQFLRRAKFRNSEFYVDTAVRDSGRRIVNHEFPKKDDPYAEDMGRRARDFTVRGYLIVFPNETSFPNDSLKKLNYITARDNLIRDLEIEGPAILQLPLLGAINAACSRYRVTEEDRLGGYCVFDMTFNEFGQAPANGNRNSQAGVFYAADNLGTATTSAVTTGINNVDSGAVSTAPPPPPPAESVDT